MPELPPTDLAHTINRLLPTGYLQRILAGEKRIASDRRTVTTLFIDLVNSTGIAERLDPEDATELVNLAFTTMAEPVRRYEGTIARLMGDGMLCLFGAPVAHEDDPVRACRAALEVIEGFRQAAPAACARYGVSAFTVRAGISTGLAVVGEVGTSERAEYTAIGDAVNLAARLQAVTEPGTALVCSDTWRLIKHAMACGDLGQVTVRGKTQPLSVYRLLHPISRSMTVETQRSEGTLVGRHAERSICRQAIEDLAQNRSSILLIRGDAGLGKSRLIGEARSYCPADIFWVETHSLAHTRFMSYWTTQELLRGLLHIDPSVTGRGLGIRIRHGISSLFASPSDTESRSDIVDDLVTSLCAVIGHLLHAPLRRREQKYLENLEAGLVHEQIAAGICTFVNLIARTKRLVVVWDDIQWVDVESRQILQALSALSRDLPLLLIISGRYSAEQPNQWLDNLLHCASLPVRTAALAPLSDADSRIILRSLLGISEVPEHIAAPLLQAAGGNPHFAQELVSALLERGQLVRGDAEGLQACRLGKVDIPHSLQAAILSRVDMLDVTAKMTVQAASVLGQDIDADIVCHMLMPEVQPDVFERSFAILEKKGFVVRKTTPTVEPQTEGVSIGPGGDSDVSPSALQVRHYSFAQALTQEVVYQSILKSRRQQLHQRAGESIESLNPTTASAFAPLLAYHFDQSGDISRAVRYLSQSAEYSAKMCAVDAAAEAYVRALSLMEHLNSQVDQDLLALLHEGLGDVYYLSSKYAEAMQQYDNARTVQTVAQRRTVLTLKCGRLLEKWGRYDAAKETFESGLKELTANYDPQLAAKFYAGLCLVYYHLDQLVLASDFGQLALELERSVHDERGTAQACSNLGIVSIKQQKWLEAEAYFKESQAIWERFGDSYGLATCFNNLGLIAKEQGNIRSAVSSFDQSLSLFTRLGNKHGMARVYDNMAELLSQTGDRQQAEEYLGKAVAILAEIGVDSTGPVAEIWQSGVW